MVIYCYQQIKKLLSGSVTTFLYIFLHLFEMPSQANSTEPYFLAPEVKPGSGTKEPGFLLSIRGSQHDISPDHASASPCSAGPWLPGCEGSPDFYTKDVLSFLPSSSNPGASPSPALCIYCHLISWFVPLAKQRAMVQLSAGLWKLTEVPCSSGTPEFDPQVWLQSATSLNTPVSPQLWSLARGGLQEHGKIHSYQDDL